MTCTTYYNCWTIKLEWQHAWLKELRQSSVATLMCLLSWVGKRSSSTSLTAALPLNKSMVIPGGRSPWCCCHFKDWKQRMWTKLSRLTTMQLCKMQLLFFYSKSPNEDTNTNHTCRFWDPLPVLVEPGDERGAPRSPLPPVPGQWLPGASPYCCHPDTPGHQKPHFILTWGYVCLSWWIHWDFFWY